MPGNHLNQTRETRTIHAPWWSNEKDANGVYLERVTVKYPLLESDSQWISGKVSEKQTMTAKDKVSGAQVSLTGMERQRQLTCMRLVTEWTDASGKNLLPQAGSMPEYIDAWWRANSDNDMDYVAEQISAMNAKPVVPVLPEDEEEAQANADKLAAGFKTVDAEMTVPALVAQDHFRPSSES